MEIDSNLVYRIVDSGRDSFSIKKDGKVLKSVKFPTYPRITAFSIRNARIRFLEKEIMDLNGVEIT